MMDISEQKMGPAAGRAGRHFPGAGTPRRILYIVPAWPRERGFGGQLRALHIGRALQQMGEVTVIVVASNPEEGRPQQHPGEDFKILDPVQIEARPNRGIWDKVRWAFDTRYFNVHGCEAVPRDRERLLASRGAYDLVWVLNARIPNILNEWDWNGAHLDIDDVPSTYLQGVAKGGGSRRERWEAALRQGLMRRRDLLWKKRFTTLSVCSGQDREYLGGGSAIHVIPNGFERPDGEPLRALAPQRARLGFIGLCTYEPNEEGVRWFLEQCWPQIQREVPGVRFRLVGMGSEELAASIPAADVDALGWIPDAAVEIATWSAMAVPIRLGGGTRVKIADAFSRKCPVVSTGHGAAGYQVRNGRELLIADDARRFAAACVDLIRHPCKGVEMASAAFDVFINKWTWDAIAPSVWAAAEDCLRRGRRI